MTTRTAAVLGIPGLLMAIGLGVAAQDTARSADPRVGLKPGFRDAGQAAHNLELVATTPRPRGFFDPKAPAGEVIHHSPDEPEAPPPTDDAPPPAGAAALDFANSDLAFRDTQLFIGNFSGFNIYEIRDPARLRLIASVVCPGGQGDVSVHGTLLFMSVEQTRGRIDCGAQGVAQPVSPERFRGVRIFDISDLKKPRQVAAVQTCRGSHTHTLLVDPKDREHVYIYGSGTATVRSAGELAGCSGADPKEDPQTSLFSIDVIKVPLANPADARIVSRPRIFTDPATGAVSGLWRGGDHGPGTQKTTVTDECHDITVFPEVGLAAGACSGNGILLDISDPVNPVRLDAVVDKNFAYWHSATFNNDGTKVIFTDEWGGGTRPRCRETDPPNWGANAIFDIVDRKLRFASYYKLPAPQSAIENCVAHNGSLVPVPGRDIMVQGWYQGGISVFDFTESAKPFEIAFFDRGPVDPARLITAGHWSAYWYNGYVYGAEMARGLDVLRLRPSEHLSTSELQAAIEVRTTEFNVQQQRRVSWPASRAVARAYLDQLERSRVLEPARLSTVRKALDEAGAGRPSAQAGERLRMLAAELERDASAGAGRDAARLRALAEVMRAIAAV